MVLDIIVKLQVRMCLESIRISHLVDLQWPEITLINFFLIGCSSGIGCGLCLPSDGQYCDKLQFIIAHLFDP